MNPKEHIRRIRDGFEGLDKHTQGNPAAYTAVKDMEIAMHEFEKAIEQEIEDKEK
jgi:hypothetical protein